MTEAQPGAVVGGPMVLPHPGGRRHVGVRPIRLGDADRRGRLRLDALARHLQDVATDDTMDARADEVGYTWVVRRAAVVAEHWPVYLERVTYTTFCGGVGSRWAERRTSARGDRGGRLEAAALWARVDLRTGRPAALPDLFHRVWSSAAGGRTVSARLRHPPPPEGLTGRGWQVRAVDVDVLEHVNNAVHWAVVEDELDRLLPGAVPVASECEYRLPLERDDAVRVLALADAGTLWCWLVSGRGTHASAVVRTAPPG